MPNNEEEEKERLVVDFPTHSVGLVGSNKFQNKFTMVFGGSMTGKTTIVKFIIRGIRESTPNFVIITPDSSRHFYEKFVPGTSIFPDLSEQTINDIVERQENALKVKKLNEKLEVLYLLYRLLLPHEFTKFNEYVKKHKISEEDTVKLLRVFLGSGNFNLQEYIKGRISSIIIDIEIATNEITKMKNLPEKAVKEMIIESSMEIVGFDFSNYGEKHYNVYKALGLLEKSLRVNPILEVLKIIRNAYCFFDINNNLCLVLDDVTPELKRYTTYSVLPSDPFSKDAPKKPIKSSDKKSIFMEIATRCRHIGFSVIIITHSFKNIENRVRKNFTACVFTSKEAFEEAMVEISPDDLNASKKHGIASKIYSMKDDNGDAFYKLVYLPLENGTTEDGKSTKLSIIKADDGEVEYVNTTEPIDLLITELGEKSNMNYTF